MIDVANLLILFSEIIILSCIKQNSAFLETMNITRRQGLDLPRLLYTAEIMPDIVPLGQIELLNVTFYNGQELEIGSMYSHRELKEPPHVYWSYNLSSIDFYTLSIVNLDDFISKLETRLQWHVWLVGNIPKNRIELGDPLIEFQAPVETKDKRFRTQHRVAIFVWRQPKGKLIKYQGPILTSSDHRWNYTIQSFMKKYRLGIPYAATYFMMNE
ncbi:phosphatidylethanolamine-binding protein 2-like isoform X2 [Planococcus citri]|uniref:phosphatidylethanolamine-binding protein 2-like isoform X2 n=1 Tax=Planococcus citri TaxID=170843 RepID=UPI0031F8C8D0